MKLLPINAAENFLFFLWEDSKRLARMEYENSLVWFTLEKEGFIGADPEDCRHYEDALMELRDKLINDPKAEDSLWEEVVKAATKDK